VVQVDVTEQSTGEISIGAGYSTSDGPLGDFSITERNLLGTGRELRFGAMISGVRSEFDISFTEPYFLNRDLSAGVDLFRITNDNSNYSSYKETDTGFRLRLGYPLSDHLRQKLTYSFERTQISDVPDTASVYIQDQVGIRNESVFGQELTYDQRNSKIDPTSGYVARLGNDVAGAGGNAKFLRSRLTGNYYIPVPGWDQWVGMIGGEAGYIEGLGQSVFISDRFFIGGDTMHGFETAGLGPRDISTGDALGGNEYYRGTLDLKFPMGLPAELGVNGHAFTDVGTLTHSGATGPNVRDSGSLRVAPGLGVQWRSPLGPIGLDLSYPVVKESYDKVEEIHFNFGTRF
jgi:outer membrane protein insertion porin family